MSFNPIGTHITRHASNQLPIESAPYSTRILVKGKYQERTNSLLTLQESLLYPEARDPITVTTISQGQEIIEHY